MSDISRRNFLKTVAAGSVAAFAASCGIKSGSDGKTGGTDAGTGPMTLRTNHNTGDKVSILGYGMMRLPMTEVTEGLNETKKIDQEMVNQLVDYALEHGVNYFDTAPVYCQGKSEEATGIALSRHPRSSYFIATKLSNFDKSAQTHEASVQMFQNSLKYLRTDYIDYLLLHSIGGGGMKVFNERFIDNGVLDYLIEQKEQGVIRNLGFSYHGDVEVFDTMLKWMDEGRVHWDFVQIQLNYVDWNTHPGDHARDAEYLYKELEKRNIPAVIMEPLLGGRLANVPQPIVKHMKERRPDDSAASWAFRFAGTEPGILTVLSGMTYMDHLQDNLRTYSSLLPCTDEEKAFLRTCALEYAANKPIPCTACQYCMPCPYGLNIPGIFMHYNQCINNGTLPRDAQAPGYAAARRAYLVSYDREVPVQRQASRCIGCGECLSHCPQKIDIPNEMREIDTYTTRLKRGEEWE